MVLVGVQETAFWTASEEDICKVRVGEGVNLTKCPLVVVHWWVVIRAEELEVGSLPWLSLVPHRERLLKHFL